MECDRLTGKVIGCAIEVHRALELGLLELTYEQCLARELSLQGLAFQLQVPLSVEYNGIHEAQLLTYMKLAGVRTGLLMNFNAEVLPKSTLTNGLCRAIRRAMHCIWHLPPTTRPISC